MRTRTVFLALALLVLGFVACARAQAPDRSARFVSDWGRRVLARSDLAATGSITAVWRLPRGSTLGFFKVEGIHWGGAEEPSVIVITPDPLLFQGEGSRYLLLLRRLSRSRYSLLDLVDLSRKDTKGRAETCMTLIDIEKLPTHMERVALFKEHVLRSLTSADAWTARFALRELYILSKRKPKLFTRAEVAMVAKMYRPGGKRTRDRYVLSILTHLEVLPPMLRAIRPREAGDTVGGVRTLNKLLMEKGITTKRRNFREEALFDMFREERDANLRARILAVMAHLTTPRLANGIIRALVIDPSPIVRAEAARTLRSFPGSGTVEFLCRALADRVPSVQESVVTTLHRLGDTAALPALRKFLERGESTGDVLAAARRAVAALEAK